MAQSYAYSQSDVTASIFGNGGSFSLGGDVSLADEGVKISLLQDSNVIKTGTSGSFVHSLVSSSAGKVTFEFLKNSVVNNKLITMYRTQLLTRIGWGLNVISIDCPSFGDSWKFVGCAFTKLPDFEYTKEAANVIWSFDFGEATGILGAGLTIGSQLSF